MTELRDPPRWAAPNSDAPRTLQRLFSDAQGDVPSDASLAALQRRLEAQLAPTAEPQPAPSGAKPTSAVTLGRVLGGVIAAGLIGLGAARLAAPEPVEAPAPAPTRVAPPPELPAPLAPQPTPTPDRSAAPATQTPPPSEVRPVPSSPVGRKKAPVDGVVAEAELLERARRALANNPSRALALTAEHKQRFPSGALRQEREVIAIDALRRVGRAREAESRAGEFEQSYPGSAHRRAVEKGLGK